MAHKFREIWDYENIKCELENVIDTLNISRMPTTSEINLATGDYSLVNAIKRHGGFQWWSIQLGIKQSECETRTGYEGEIKVKELLESKGYEVKKMPVKYPYDLLVNDNIKIDVKTAHKHKSNTGWASYSFGLEKENPTCDIYYIWCIEDNKMLIIPSKFLHQKQLCITDKKSKYDKFIDRFDYIDKYDKFYKKITI